MNKLNLKKVINHIKAHPETWNQRQWHCGTTHCIAGHCQIMLGNAPNTDTARRDARIFLDISKVEADWLFDANRTLADFEYFLSSKDGYDRAGYDRFGYDRFGYSRAGYDRAGYDCAGYDRNGYNRAGCDSDGLDKDNKPKSTVSMPAA